MTNEEILEELKKPEIKDCDFKQFDFTQQKFDLSNKRFERVDFSTNKTIKNISFKKSVFVDCKFEKAAIENCEFENAEIESCDFRYTKITDTTFKEANFELCDFHQAVFLGITVFQDSKFKLCSLSYVSFGEFCITQHNFPEKFCKPILIQEDKEKYEIFLRKVSITKKLVAKDGMSEDEIKEKINKKIDDALDCRFREAARIYRQFSAMWGGKGHNKDSDWAYLKSKRRERCRFFREKWKEIKKKNNDAPLKFWDNVKNIFITLWYWIRAALNLLCDVFLGYGVRLRMVLFSYALIILGFAIFYYCNEHGGFKESLFVSLEYTTGLEGIVKKTTKELFDNALEFQPVLQKGLGMFLTGVFGFMVANKIRKS